MKTKNADPAKVRLTNVRLSFPNLFTPKSIEEGKEPKYSANFLLNKGTQGKQVREIQAAIVFVTSGKWPKGAPKTIKTCLKEAADKEEYAGYDEEHMVLNTSSTRRPPVVNKDLSPITESDGILYPGCYVNATVRLFAFEHPVGGKGTSCEILAVQFARDGESLGGFTPVDIEEEFGVIEDDDSGDLGADDLL